MWLFHVIGQNFPRKFVNARVLVGRHTYRVFVAPPQTETQAQRFEWSFFFGDFRRKAASSSRFNPERETDLNICEEHKLASLNTETRKID